MYILIQYRYKPERGIKFRSELRDLEVPEDGSAVFDCEISHNDVAVTWFLKDEPVKSSENAK